MNMPTTTLISRDPSVLAAIMRMDIRVRKMRVVHMEMRRMTTRAPRSLKLSHEEKMTNVPGKARDFHELPLSPSSICVSVMLVVRTFFFFFLFFLFFFSLSVSQRESLHGAQSWEYQL